MKSKKTVICDRSKPMGVEPVTVFQRAAVNYRPEL